MAVVSGLEMGESPGSRNKTDDPGATVSWCSPASRARAEHALFSQEDAQDPREASCLMLAWPRGLLSSRPVWPVSCGAGPCWGKGQHPAESCFQLRAAAELTSQVLILPFPRSVGGRG